MRETPKESTPAPPSAQDVDAVTTTHVFVASVGAVSTRPAPAGAVATKHADPAAAFGAYHEPIASA
jgi:hypothetical protein